MPPIRILQVFASLDRGGAETMIMNLYQCLDRDKIQFDFAVNENTAEYAYEHQIEALGGRVFRMPKYSIKNHKAYKQSWMELLETHGEWRVIHGHHTSPALVYLGIARKLGLITIAHSHTAGGGGTLKSYIKYGARFPLRFIADHLFACSESAADWMFGKGSARTVLKNAIDTKEFAYDPNQRKRVRNQLGLTGEFALCHIGNFSRVKNHPFLLRVFASVHERNENARLFLIGKPDDAGTVEQKIRELHLEDVVTIMGVRDDIPELLQAMDVFLLPSLYEGLPMVLVEAQASGLQCFASDTITEEVIATQRVEMLSLKKSPEHWAERILEYEEGYERRETRQEIRTAGYDVMDTAKWLEKFYLDEYLRI